MKTWIAYLIAICALLTAFYSVRKVRVGEDEYYTQKITLPSGTVEVIHRGYQWKCIYYNPVFKKKGKILQYEKHRNHVYCSYCWDDGDISILEACSKRNIIENYYSEEAEDYYLDPDVSVKMYNIWEWLRSELVDTTERRDYIQYAYDQGKLNRISESDIPDKYEFIKWFVEAGENQ